jgi:hypothetical protein
VSAAESSGVETRLTKGASSARAPFVVAPDSDASKRRPASVVGRGSGNAAFCSTGTSAHVFLQKLRTSETYFQQLTDFDPANKSESVLHKTRQKQ